MNEFVRLDERLVGDGYKYTIGLSAVDLTGDGSLDLVSTDTDVGLYWYENDGRGGFTKHVVHRKTPEWLERHEIADINGDGKPEVVTIDNINDSVLWFEFDGDPRDADNWTSHYICEGDLPGAYDVAVADFDGDGEMEVAASSWVKGNRFAYFDRQDGEWVKTIIEEDVSETRMIQVADVNHDGRPDLMCTATGDNLLVWYENPGDPSNKPVDGQRKCPAKWPAKMSLVLLAMITDGSYSTRSRFMGGLRASMYFFAVSRWMPSSRATPRVDNPLRFAF